MPAPRILILGINHAPEMVGIGPYTAEMAAHMAARNHEVSIVTAQPYYPAWRIDPDHGGLAWRETREKNVTILRCPLYVPATPSGAKRLIHHASFALSALAPMIRRARSFRPDLVMTIAPSLIAAPVALLAARLANARSWLHVQDFEIEAAFATGLMDQSGFAARAGLGFERRVMRAFDRVSTISPQMCARLRDKGIAPDRIYEFRNWANIDAIRPLDAPSAYRSEWGITTPHVALYSGNIANKQGIDIVLDAARLLRHRSDISFVICGEGPNRDALKAAAADLPAIQFHVLQPRERLSELLGLASVHLLPQRAEAADLVLPSKLTNILASGRPVVATAAAGTGIAEEIEGCGLRTAPGDAAEFAAAIAKLCDDAALAQSMGTAARLRAESAWSREAILDRLIEQIEPLIHA